MIDGVRRAHRRADCALVGAIAIVAVTGASAREFILYTDEQAAHTDEQAARAALPDSVPVTGSVIAFAKAENAVQSECLAEVLYYEARGEGIEGQKAVAEVVLQRTRDSNYPATVCGVAFDGAQNDRHACQFSFACDGALSRPKDKWAWRRVTQLAEKIVAGTISLTGQTGRAIAFHNVDVTPAWADSMLRTAQIGSHVFYRRDPSIQARLLQTQANENGRQGLPSQEIQSQVQTASAVGDGA
jgi:spore germination cell wall hydrolase CwlJ-like protein